MAERPLFVIGAGGAGFQVEDQRHVPSNWRAHEQALDTNALVPAGRAADFDHRFPEYFGLAADSGQTGTRLSLEWARLQPEPGGQFSPKAVELYRNMLGSAQEVGLYTLAVLHHFTHPATFSWTDPEAISLFNQYVRGVAYHFGDLLEDVGTINEPQLEAAAGYALGYFPPRMSDIDLAQQVSDTLIQAHSVATQTLHDMTGARVVFPLAISDYRSVDDTQEAIGFRDFVHHSMVGVYLEALQKGKIIRPDARPIEVPGARETDVLGIQYYTPVTADIALLLDPEASAAFLSGASWEVSPESLGKIFDEVAATLPHMELIVSENGIDTPDEDVRMKFIRDHLRQVRQARDRGINITGYYYWSLLKTYEWNIGPSKFGLIDYDPITFDPLPKKSLYEYPPAAREILGI